MVVVVVVVVVVMTGYSVTHTKPNHCVLQSAACIHHANRFFDCFNHSYSTGWLSSMVILINAFPVAFFYFDGWEGGKQGRRIRTSICYQTTMYSLEVVLYSDPNVLTMQ